MERETAKCFVITPIGDEGSDTRLHSDKALQYLIEPALRLCGFASENIIRIDKEPEVGSIINRIFDHIRNDELCIVDLTGLNANVMFEYGMRKGVGKPCIILADRYGNKDFRLPFDVHDENTIFYSLDMDTVFLKQQEIEKRVRMIQDQGFYSQKNRGSIQDVYDRLDAIDQKLTRYLSGVSNGTDSRYSGGEDYSEVIDQLGLVGAFNFALQKQDIALGEYLLPLLERRIDRVQYIDKAVAQMAALGSKKAGEILASSWSFIEQNLDIQHQIEELGSYISYCTRRDIEPENLAFIEPIVQKLLEKSTNAEDKAAIYNQVNRIYYGAWNTLGEVSPEAKEYLDKAIDALEKALALSKQDDASYHYNLAICYRDKNMMSKAVKHINDCVRIDENTGDEDSDHLALAYQIYFSEGELEKANDILQRLSVVAPLRAQREKNRRQR